MRDGAAGQRGEVRIGGEVGMRYELAVGEKLVIPTGYDTVFTWEYDRGRERLLNLYAKGKQKQWDAEFRIDWDIPVDPSNPEHTPDPLVPIYGSSIWERATAEEKAELRWHMAAWLNSQFLHGEQGALFAAAKIVQVVPDVDLKLYAATQVVDEARHVEVYTKYLGKIGKAYPVNPHLKVLLDEVVRTPKWDMTCLGMQIMVEGLALAAFSILRDLIQEPLGKQIATYVMEDEARHVAFGRLALRDYYPELSEAERAEREEFVVEAAYLMRDRFTAEEVWEHVGVDAKEAVDYTLNSTMMREFRKVLFSRIVPAVKDIGLWGERVRRAFEEMGVIQFAEGDLEALSARDEEIAAELDRAKAETRKVMSMGEGGRS